MTKKNTKTIAIVAVLGGALAFYLMQAFESRYFPALPSGAYLGSVTGLGAVRDESSAFYLERLPDSDVFIAVAFAEGFRPQALQAERLGESGATGKSGFLPLKILRDQSALLFSGSGDDSEFRGKIHLNDETVGRWNLSQVQADKLMGKLESTPEVLKQWLELKSQFRTFRQAARQYQDRARDASAKKEKLVRFVEDEALLRERATKRRDSLAAELKAALEERKQTTTMLQDLVGQLELVGRISKTGQAILLARRVANRENQWYVANWQTEEGSEFLEENLGADSTVDFQKLESAVRASEEVQGLLRERETEKKKIHQLETELSSGVAVIQEPVSSENQIESDDLAPTDAVDAPRDDALRGDPQRGNTEKKTRGSLWDRLFD